MKKIVLLYLFCFGALIARSEGIEFFHGDFNAALEKAKAENKVLFVDFMATWCGPCTRMAESVFPDQALGEYFNSRFICLKVDVDQSKELVERYLVESMPTLIFMDASGKELMRLNGFMPAERLLKKAKELEGGVVSVDDLWAMYEKDKNNLEVMQALLQEVPYEGMGKYSGQGEGLILEVYNNYMKLKPRKAVINKADFDIIMMYRNSGVSAEMVQFVCGHLSDYLKVVPFGEVYDAIVPYTGGLIDGLAKAGNLKYKKMIEQAVTEQKAVFDSLKVGSWTVKEFLLNRAEGYYMLYAKKDQAAFVKLRMEYFKRMGDQADVESYKAIIGDLFEATEEKLTVDAAKQCVEWLKTCLRIIGDNPEEQLGVYVTMGDLYMMMGNKVKAKESYTKANELSLTSNDPELQGYIQGQIDLLE